MKLETLERDSTIIEFFDDCIKDDLTESRKMDLEIFVVNSMEKIKDVKRL